MNNLTKKLPASSLLVKLGIATQLLLFLVLMSGNYSYALVDTSTTTISSGNSSTTFGDTVTFKGRVLDTTNIPPTGTLTFMSGNDVLGIETLVTNSSPLNISSMPSSSGYTPPANWNYQCTTCPVIEWGDYVYWVFSASNNSSNYNIVAYDSDKTIVKQVPVAGDRYIAAITDNSNGTITLTGQGGTVNVNLSLLDIAEAEFTTTSLAVGTHSITATYSGDDNHTSSVSNTVTQIVIDVSYTVSFDSNGGTDVASQSVLNNGTATSPTAPTKAGYTFAGWYSNIGLTSVYSFGTPVTADTTLYAGWTINYGLDGTGPNLAENSTGSGYPSISASFTCCQNQDNPWYAINGVFSLNRWTNYGGNSTDWLAINFGSATTFNKVNLYLFNDGGGVQPPGSYNVQYWNGSVWVDAANQVKSPVTPSGSHYSIATEANTLNTVTFDTVVAQQIRVVFTNGSGYVGIVELEIFYEAPIPLGDGTSSSPYQLSNIKHLQFMADHLSSHYILINNIDMANVTWTPIGATSSFEGRLDGQGYSLRDLSINSNTDNIGLFGIIGSSGVVKNLTIDSAVVVGNSKVGALAGTSQGNIDNVIVNNANVSGTDYVGGLIGNHELGTIKDSHFSGVVSGAHFVGGLTGASSASVTESSSAATVTGTGYYIAGLVGYLHSDYGLIANSYASGNITGPSNTGGLVGQNAGATITNSFALGSVSSGGALVGYNFNGFIIDSYASGLVNGSGQSLTEGTAVTNSSWKPYIAYFDSNGGTTVNIRGLNSGDLVTAPTQPTKAGHTFVGWYSDAGLSTSYTFDTVITAYTPIYAKWLINSYTITYNSNGGEQDADPTSQTVIYGNTVGSLPVAPTRVEHIFTGWTTEANGGGTAFDAATVVTGSVTVYAQWTINSYTVTFNTDGGSPVISQTVIYNEMASEPSAPTKAGYIFANWYTDTDYATTFHFASTPITADTTIHALWISYLGAEALVNIAELHQTQVAIDAAYATVLELIDSVEKTELIARILIVQDLIDLTTIEIDDIVKLITEGTLQQKDINQDGSFDSLDVQIMLQRIS